MAEFHCNRSSADVSHCGYTSRIKWNLDPADPTGNESHRGGSDYGKKCNDLVTGEIEYIFFFGFMFFYILFLDFFLYVY